MPPDMLFDYLAVRLNGPEAAGKKIGLNIDFTDLKQQYGLVVENAVLNYGKPLTNPMRRSPLPRRRSIQSSSRRERSSRRSQGGPRNRGQEGGVRRFLGLLDTFPFWFNIVTP